jgi:hypothetical protein
MVPIRALVGLVALALAAPAASAPAQLALMKKLHECLADVASHTPKIEYVSPCAMQDVTILVGVSRSDLLGSLGPPTFCYGATHQIALWSDPVCRAALELGYSFYRLCRNCIGGGPELVVQLDSAGAVGSLRWVHTQ